MVKNSLELSSGFGTSAFRQISLAPHIDRIERSIQGMDGAARSAQLVGSSSLQQIDGLRTIAPVQCQLCSKHRQITEVHRGIFGESLLEIIRESLSP